MRVVVVLLFLLTPALKWFTPRRIQSIYLVSSLVLTHGEGEKTVKKDFFLGGYGKTHIKKKFFLVVGPPRFYPPYTYVLVVHATFFLFIITYTDFDNFFFFYPIFGLKQPDFRKKSVFCLVVRGVYSLHPPHTLSGPTTKKHFF